MERDTEYSQHVFEKNLQLAIKWLVRVARNTCLSEPAAVTLMCGDFFQLGVLVFAESKGRQTKDTSAWHFQWCQSQEGLFRVGCLQEGWCNHTQFSASAHRLSVARIRKPPHTFTAS